MSERRRRDEGYEHLEEILSRPAFQEADQDSVWETIQEALLGWLRQWFPEVDVASGSLNFVSYAVIGIALLTLIFLIYWFSKQIIKRRTLQEKVKLTQEEVQETTMEDYLFKAQNVSDAAQYSEGIRHAFVALLLALEKQQAIEVRPWKSNLEYLREIESRRKEKRRMFYEWASLFEKVWYGQEQIDARQYAQYVQLVEREVKEGESYAQVE